MASSSWALGSSAGEVGGGGGRGGGWWWRKLEVVEDGGQSADRAVLVRVNTGRREF